MLLVVYWRVRRLFGRVGMSVVTRFIISGASVADRGIVHPSWNVSNLGVYHNFHTQMFVGKYPLVN